MAPLHREPALKLASCVSTTAKMCNGMPATVEHEPTYQVMLQAVRRSKAGRPFAEPVVLDEVPGYLAVVSRPMDLGTVMEGLFAGHYQTPGEPGPG